MDNGIIAIIALGISIYSLMKSMGTEDLFKQCRENIENCLELLNEVKINIKEKQ